MAKIIYNKQKIALALCMACMGTAVGAVSQNYPFPYEEPVFPAPQRTAAEEQKEIPAVSRQATPSEAEEVPEEKPFVFIPYSGQLNLAYFYPEGADESDRLNSYAGITFKKLTERDSQWMAEIYDLSGKKPEQIAKMLGRSPDSVRGLFNPKDEEQKQEDPSSWLIHSWKRVNLAFYDENGRQIPAYSNVKDILSMASVYTYYAGMEDHELFEAYAQELWKRSHSYSYSISDVYYCDGCLDGEESEISDESGLVDGEEDSVETGPGTAGNPKIAAKPAEEAQPSSAPADSGSSSEEHPDETGAVSETAQASQESSQPSPAHNGEIGPGISLASPSDASHAQTETVESAPQAESTEAAPEEGVSLGASEADKIKCPGHVDLNIQVTISGINGLFQKDTIGTDKRNLKEGGWRGWDTYNRYYAKKINGQDWKEQYGLSVTEICVRNPLSAGEIESYMALLPEGTSENRKKLIQFALSSVGRIPYYWGGKPEAGNYEGNAFCSLMLPDSRGRSLRGLDCSGWINWVYWSSLGMRLPYEGTDGLSTYGTAIRREDLKPGDIIVKRGANAHVVMFLSWQPDGTMQVIHETSGGINNVTVGTMNANWPYYRRILD